MTSRIDTSGTTERKPACRIRLSSWVGEESEVSRHNGAVIGFATMATALHVDAERASRSRCLAWQCSARRTLVNSSSHRPAAALAASRMRSARLYPFGERTLGRAPSGSCWL